MTGIVGLLPLLGLLVACDKPSEDDCEAAADKFFELLAEREGHEVDGEPEEKMRDAFKKSCITSGTRRELACIQSATTFDDLEACQR